MKKYLLSLVLCALCIAQVKAVSIDPEGQPVNFSVIGIIDPESNGHLQPRSPICPPEAVLSGHTLYILTEHPDYNLQLLSADDTVVYETYVPSTVNVVALPTFLTGEFEIQLQTDTYIFIGRIEL